MVKYSVFLYLCSIRYGRYGGVSSLRCITKLNKSTTNCMLYGELGKCCISNLVKERMVNFCSRLVTTKRSKISYMVYTAIKSLDDRTDISFQSKWIGNMTKYSVRKWFKLC